MAWHLLLQKMGWGGQVLTEEAAATRIQARARGMVWRARTRSSANRELVFLGMRPRVRALPYSAPASAGRALVLQ